MQIPFFTTKHQNSRYGRSLLDAIGKVVDSGSFILGEEVKEFEKRLAVYCGVKHAIGVANGSDALYLIVQAARLPAGSEVITTPYTFFASTACLVRNGLKPVFGDVDGRTYHLDVAALEKKLTKHTSAVLSTDLFSHTADNDELARFANRHGLVFLEDSAEAFGMRWNGAHAGARAKAGVLSFFPTKTLGCFGDGGAILTNDDSFARECRINRVHGAEKKYIHTSVGINSRLDEMQAAILNVKLEHVDTEIKERARIVEAYRAGLKGVSDMVLPFVPLDAQPAWYVFAPAFSRRDELASFLQSKGIGTSVYWPKPLHLQECFAGLGYKRGDFPVSERLCNETLALPVYVGMTDDEVQFVCDAINTFYKQGC